jgi:beta-lactamase class D
MVNIHQKSLIILCLILSACAPVLSTPVSQTRPDLEQYFQGHKGAFVLYDQKANSYIRYNPERCAEQFLPASTYKILNALIGLETGIIPDENYVIKWDGQTWPIAVWNQDHTLKSAFQNSVVWYFLELARRVGPEKMKKYVEAADYGNKDITGPSDAFWLDGNLRISADQQVEFLKRFYAGDLPFSKRSLEIVKVLMIVDKKDTFTLSGKTGSVVRVATYQGWFVGYLETQGNVYFFATNMESTNPDGLANGATARQISLDILKSLKLLP